MLEERTLLSSTPPVANDDFTHAAGANPLHIDILSNDSPAGQLNPASVRIVTAPSHGTITAINTTDGSLTYTASPGFAGTDTLGYTVADYSGNVSNEAIVSVVVNGPTATDDSLDTDGTNPVTVDVLANDSDSTGSLNPAGVHVSSNPTHGQITHIDTATGKITYQANAGFMGADTFGYTVTDNEGAVSNQATVTIVVNRPTANDDFVSTDGTNPVTIDVLGNDTDPDGNNELNPASVAITSDPANGKISHVDMTTGQITYQADPGFFGTETFQYTVIDFPGAVSNPATVTVVVNRPRANDDFTSTTGTNAVTVDVLANDSDPAGNSQLNPASVTVTSNPGHGTITHIDTTTGKITYQANSGFFGTDTFLYTVTNQAGAVSNAATVTVDVRGSGTLNDDAVSTNGTNAVAVNVLANDTSQRGFNPSTVTLVPGSGPNHGHITGIDRTTGKMTYQANSGFAGTDTFCYTVQDIDGTTFGPATVSIVVNLPTATDDSIDTDGTNAVTVDVLANDSDPAGHSQLNPASVTVTSNPAHGSITAVDVGTGAITYQANTGFFGSDTFRYTVADRAGAVSNEATVTVVINRPTANDDFVTTDGTHPVKVDVLANDSDPDGNQEINAGSVTVTTNPAHGHITGIDSSTGAITYQADPGFGGTDTFQYTVTDFPGAVSNPATVTVVVNRPQANDDSIDTDGTNPVTVDVLSNDTDPSGSNQLNPAGVSVTENPGHGHITGINTTTGVITYQADAGFRGTDTFHYTVTNLAGAVSNQATVTVVVNRPTATNDSAVTLTTTPVTVDVLANDTDPDGNNELNPASVTVTSNPSHGHISGIDSSTGRITYQADPGFLGVDTFRYTVTDFPGAVSNEATVSISVVAPPLPSTLASPAPSPQVPSAVQVLPAPGGHGLLLQVIDPRNGSVRFTVVLDHHHAHRGMLSATLGDVNHDGIPDLILTTGSGRHLLVEVFNGATGALMSGPLGMLAPFGHHLTGRIELASADINGDGFADILVGNVANGRLEVRVFSGADGAVLEAFSERLHRGGLTTANVDSFFATLAQPHASA